MRLLLLKFHDVLLIHADTFSADLKFCEYKVKTHLSKPCAAVDYFFIAFSKHGIILTRSDGGECASMNQQCRHREIQAAEASLHLRYNIV